MTSLRNETSPASLESENSRHDTANGIANVNRFVKQQPGKANLIEKDSSEPINDSLRYARASRKLDCFRIAKRFGDGLGEHLLAVVTDLVRFAFLAISFSV